MRHMLAFLPFHWLMLGPVIEKVLSRAARSAVLCLLACAAVTGLAAVQSLAQKMSAHERVAANTESLVRLLAEDPKERVTVISGNQNLFFDLKFLAPDKSIDYVGIPDMLAARAGRIVIARSALIDPLGPPTTPLVRVARYFLSGRTTYDVWREKRD
jgi:hypothetical protein